MTQTKKHNQDHYLINELCTISVLLDDQQRMEEPLQGQEEGLCGIVKVYIRESLYSKAMNTLVI